MPEAKSQAILEKIYSEILSLKREVSKISAAIIHEEEPEDDEEEAYRTGKEEISAGEYRPWSEVKKEMEIE